jgi:hypothetical protein
MTVSCTEKIYFFCASTPQSARECVLYFIGWKGKRYTFFFFKRSFLGAIKTLPKKYEALLAYSHLNHHVKVNKVKRIVTM